MAKQRLIIDNFPIQGGLTNAGSQAVIPEKAFWEMEGAATGLDGRVYKRAGLKQWGQRITAPDTDGVAIHEVFQDLSHWNVDADNNGTSISVEDNQITLIADTYVSGSHFATIMRRVPQPMDGTMEGGDSGIYTVRMLIKPNGPLPEQDTLTGGLNGPAFGARCDTATELKLLFLDEGIHYYNGVSFTPIDDTNIDDNRWHVIELQVSGTSLSVFLDDEETARATVTFTTFTADSMDLSAHSIGFSAGETDGGDTNVSVDFVQYASGAASINGIPITAIYDWSSHNPDLKHLVVVAGGTIYDDLNHTGVFRTLDSTPKGPLTVFSPWLGELLIANPQRKLKRWNGNDLPEEEPLVLPNNVYLVSSHLSRVCVVSEDSPLRVHISAANDISDWTTEDSVSASGESFFINIPDERGKRVVAMQGDFFGQLLIWTEESVFSLKGSSIDTFVLQRISQATGSLGPRAYDLAAKDALFLSSRGVHSVATVVEYGDLAASDLSAFIRNLWQSDNQFGLHKMVSDFRSSLVHAPELARTYLAVRMQGDTRPANIFEYNHDSQRWSGPWPVECEAIDFVLLGVPGVPTLLVGGTDGRVSRVASDRRSDFLDTSYSFRVRSARIDGRSLDESIRRRDKVWHELRLFVLPRGAEGFELSYKADGHKRGQPEEVTVDQNVYNEGLVDTTFFLDSSHIVDAEKVGVVTQILDIRGKWFEFTVESSTTDSDLVILGFQVDFSVAQDSKENA